MADPVHIAAIAKRSRQRRRQTKPSVCCSQQRPSSIRAAAVVIELDDDRLAQKVGEQPTLCRGIVTQAGTSCGVKKLFRASLS
jgi:hypothetical protein